MYKVLAETHSHSLASTHAYSTIGEMMAYAKAHGIEAVAITDHGPQLPDGPHEWHFGNLKELPRYIDGVILIKGIEANILDFNGNTDVNPIYQKRLELVIASMHDCVIAPSTVEEHTKGWLEIAKVPYIDIIGHSGQEIYKYDYERVIPEFKKYNKAVEINNHSFEFRKGSFENCTEILRLCKKYEVNIVLGSDAHSAYKLCNTELSSRVLETIDFPEELILNTTAKKFITWLENKKNIKIM